MNLGNLEALIQRLAEDGTGTTVRPVRKGERRGGWGSDESYDLDGWEVGYINGGGGGDLSAAPTLEDAIDLALEVLDSADD